MKLNSLLVAALAVFFLSSCYSPCGGGYYGGPGYGRPIPVGYSTGGGIMVRRVVSGCNQGYVQPGFAPGCYGSPYQQRRPTFQPSPTYRLPNGMTGGGYSAGFNPVTGGYMW